MKIFKTLMESVAGGIEIGKHIELRANSEKYFDSFVDFGRFENLLFSTSNVG